MRNVIAAVLIAAIAAQLCASISQASPPPSQRAPGLETTALAAGADGGDGDRAGAIPGVMSVPDPALVSLLVLGAAGLLIRHFGRRQRRS